MNLVKKLNIDTLQTVLTQCNDASVEGYKEASSILKDVTTSRKSAGALIKSSIKEMKRHGVNDRELYATVTSQLTALETTFVDIFNDAELAVNIKKAQTDSFNIVLFGRTMCGKSTLREILTNGDGSTIGKGGQRTTVDIRQYQWQGMTVTDVPGIDAFDGDQDDRLAEDAAKYADLIIFMITAGQPEGTEADWLIRLKRMDKPIICLCNVKRGLSDERRLQRFLKNPETVMNNSAIEEIKEQFNDFIHKELPNEYVSFLVVQLLAKYLSMHHEDKDIRRRLNKASKFEYVEQRIITDVINNGLSYRKRCYLSIIDNVVYSQYIKLLDFCTQSYILSRNVKDNIEAFDKWKEKFNRDEYDIIKARIDIIFNELRESVPGFVDKNFGDKDANKTWEDKIRRFNLSDKITVLIEHAFNKAEKQINERFSDLGQELKFTLSKTNSVIKARSFNDWKKITGWTSALAGVGAVVGFLALNSNPIGWVFTGISILFSLFSWFSESKSEKKRKAMEKMSTDLYEWIDKSHEDAIRSADKSFNKSIVQGLERVATDRFYLLMKTILTLTNSQRILGWDACEIHNKISLKIIRLTMLEIGLPESETFKVLKVARVPGKKTVIIVTGFVDCSYIVTNGSKERGFSLPLAIQKKIGSGESIEFVIMNINEPLKRQFFTLLKKFNLEFKHVKWIEDKDNEEGSNSRCYIPKCELDDSQVDNLNLIQQLLKVHIIQI